jgi:nucleoside-diphosphate-sugar epimerase
MALPRLIITGASGFIGRQLLDYFKDDFKIVGLARRSQLHAGAPVHNNITWYQVDIADGDSLAKAFDYIRESGGADYLIHLAAHYDFTGEDDTEYWRTNVHGMRNVLDLSRKLDLKRFIFTSSLAACAFPPHGKVLTESSPPDGDHVYAVTKRIGEEMLAEFDEVPSCIIRLAALFSDWCEYAPLYIFLETWLSEAWNSNILGGRGTTAIPYMHVREMGPFVRKIMEANDTLGQHEVVIASPSETLSHKALYDLANIDFYGQRRRPILMPKPLALVGTWGRDLVGRLLGDRPFERPWMISYLDTDLAVDASCCSGACRSWSSTGAPTRTSGTASTAPPSKRSTCATTCASTVCSNATSTPSATPSSTRCCRPARSHGSRHSTRSSATVSNGDS